MHFVVIAKTLAGSLPGTSPHLIRRHLQHRRNATIAAYIPVPNKGFRCKCHHERLHVGAILAYEPLIEVAQQNLHQILEMRIWLASQILIHEVHFNRVGNLARQRPRDNVFQINSICIEASS